MSVEESGNVRRAAAWRKRRAEAGESQVTVWLETRQIETLDQLVLSGLAKNRSEAVAHVVRNFGQKEV